MATTETKAIKAEMQGLCTKHGLIKPSHIVAFAKRRKTSAIGKWMEKQGGFDPDKSMKAFQIALARQLIMRVKIVVPDGHGDVLRIRAYVSLDADRRTGAGYRNAMSVLSEDEYRMQLAATFAHELAALETRYQTLRRIERFAPVFKAIADVTDSDAAVRSRAG